MWINLAVKAVKAWDDDIWEDHGEIEYCQAVGCSTPQTRFSFDTVENGSVKGLKTLAIVGLWRGSA